MHKSAPLLTLFFKELVHELRTPLSVISNELYILKSNGVDTGHAAEKSKHINGLLNKYRELVDFEDQFETVNVADLLKDLTTDKKLEVIQKSPELPLQWKVYRQSTSAALQEIFNLIFNFLHQDGTLTIILEARIMNINTNSNLPFIANLKGTFSPSSIISANSSTSPCLLALIDLVFFYNYLTLQISDEKTLRIKQDLP